MFSSVTASNLLGAELNTANVRNGEVLTAAHWGMLKVSVKDGKIVKSEPFQKTSEVHNPLIWSINHA